MVKNKIRKNNYKINKILIITIVSIVVTIISIFVTIYSCNKNNINEVINDDDIIKTENSAVENSNNMNISSVIPDVEKSHPKAAYTHNTSAKRLLDIIIITSDRDIQDLLKEVFNELNKSISADNEFGETYYFLGVAFRKQGDYFSSIDSRENIINAYNESLYNFDKAEYYHYNISNIYFDKGITYSMLGDYFQIINSTQSEEYYNKAIECFNWSLNSKYNYPENVYFALGNIYYKIANYINSVESYSKALLTANNIHKPTRDEIFFARSNAYYNFGLNYFNERNYEMAIQCYKNAISDVSSNYSAHYELGKTYTFINQWENAEKQFEYILEHNPNYDPKNVKESLVYVRKMTHN